MRKRERALMQTHTHTLKATSNDNGKVANLLT